MTPDEYKKQRKRIGSQQHVAGLLDVTVTTISRRECGHRAITKEAELAMEYLADTFGKEDDQKL